MSKYSVSFGVTYWVEADSEEAAMEAAEQSVLDDWGKGFYREAWASNPEVVDEV